MLLLHAWYVGIIYTSEFKFGDIYDGLYSGIHFKNPNLLTFEIRDAESFQFK